MGYAAGSPTGSTGVGSSENATGQSQQTGFPSAAGGKGGGSGSLPQPESSSTANSAPAPVYGGNQAMRLNRPGNRLMDPSASMPTTPQTTGTTTPPPAAGGKGGGYGDITNDQGFKDFIEFYNSQQNQPQKSPNAEDNKPGSAAVEATDKFAAPTTSAETEKTAINNPFEMQMKTMQTDYEQKLKALEDRINASANTASAPFTPEEPEEPKVPTSPAPAPEDPAETSLPPKDEFATLEDKGAEKYELGKPYEKLTNATTLSAETKKAADEVANPTPPPEAPPDYYTNKDYKFDTYADYADEDVANMSDKEVKSLYNSKILTANADAKQATADYNAAIKSGDIKKANAAKANKLAQEAEIAKAKADQKRRADAAKAKATAAKKAEADKKKADAVAAAAEKKRIADEKKAAKKTTTKKATGGVIHNGMSNRLKQMIGE